MITKRRLFLGLVLGLGLAASAQTPAPSPSEKELQAPLNLGDEKPTQTRTTYQEPSGWRALGSVVIVLGICGGGLWAFRKWGSKRLPGSGGHRLKIEETLALGDRRFVSILRADEESFLITLGPQGIQLLSRLDQYGPEVATDGPQGTDSTFGDTLARQVELSRPMPVREVEAMIRKDQS